MTSPEPMRPDAVETVLFEPDDQRVLAVLPGAIWLAPGDVVELDDPPRDARVLSSRLQLTAGGARVLVVLDVPDRTEETFRGDTTTEAVLATDVAAPGAGLDVDIDRELAALAPEPEPQDGPRP